MFVLRVQGEIVLENQGSEPHIVCWNRSALFPELPEHSSIMMCGLIVGINCANTIL